MKSPDKGDGSVPPSHILGALTLALVGLSSAALFVRFAAPLDSAVIAWVRVGTTAVVLFALGPRSFWQAVADCAASPRIALFVSGAALLLALHFLTWIASLALTSVVVSVTLVSTQPLFAALLGRLVGDRASARIYAGSVIAILGSMLMVGTSAPSQAPSHLLGAMLAVLGAVTAAGYLLVGRRVRDALPFLGYFSLVNLGAFVFLGVAVAQKNAPLVHPGAETGDFLAAIYLGLVPGVLGHGLLNWAVRRVAVHVVSLAAVLEPVGATLLAWLVLAEHANAREILGGAVLLFGVALGLKPSTSGEGAAEAPPASP